MPRRRQCNGRWKHRGQQNRKARGRASSALMQTVHGAEDLFAQVDRQIDARAEAECPDPVEARVREVETAGVHSLPLATSVGR